MKEYNAAFGKLAQRFRDMEGWEARQENPPAAYLHVSKPSWKDHNLNGIHFETCVMEDQLRAPVCLHCEHGFPGQKAFMKLFTERARARIEEWEGYEVLGPKGCSVCEVWVPLCPTVEETMEALAREIIRLQELTPMIDQTIHDILQ